MPSWSPHEVATFAQHLGLGSELVARLRALSVGGTALGTLAAHSAAPTASALFPDAPRAEEKEAERMVLAATVGLLLKCRHKLSVPQATVETLRGRFPGMEIEEGHMKYGDLVGEGAYGLVYHAYWQRAEVAVKAFRAGRNGNIPRDFFSELSVLERLRHPNITLLVGYLLRPYCAIVTELVPGGSLFEKLHRGRRRFTPGFSWLVEVAREICLGIVYLHANNIVHCDLKSSNILLNGTQAKLCDFGLAHALPSGQPDETSINIGCVGTHHWMAPEVLRGEEYSKASDVYSFGVVVWEMVSRRTPFKGYSPVQVIGLVGYGRRRPRLPPGCPGLLRTLLEGMLRSQPRSRRSSQDVGAELEALHRTVSLGVEDSLRAFLAG